MKKFDLLKHYSIRERKKFPFVALLLFLPLLQFAIFYVFVNINSLFVAFQDNDGAYTIVNFQRVFQGFFGETPLLRFELLRSFITWLVTNVILFPLSIVFSYALFKKIPAHMVFRVILYLPTMLGGVVMVKLYKYLLDYNGPIITLLTALGSNLSPEVLQSGLFGSNSTAFPAILSYGIWIGAGSNTVILTGALVRIPHEVFEASKLDGVGFFREFFDIAIPMIYPTLNTILIFSMAAIFTADSGTFLFTTNGGYNTSTIGFRLFYEVYLISNAGVGNGNTAYGYPAALGLVISAITIPIVLFMRRVLEKHLEAVGY